MERKYILGVTGGVILILLLQGVASYYLSDNAIYLHDILKHKPYGCRLKYYYPQSSGSYPDNQSRAIDRTCLQLGTAIFLAEDFPAFKVFHPDIHYKNRIGLIKTHDFTFWAIGYLEHSQPRLPLGPKPRLQIWYDSNSGILLSTNYPREYAIAPPAFQEKMRQLKVSLPALPKRDSLYKLSIANGKPHVTILERLSAPAPITEEIIVDPRTGLSVRRISTPR